MEKLKMETKDIIQENIEKIGALFPNVITEMKDEEKSTTEKIVYKKGINFELLKQELTGDIVEGEECYDFTWVGKKAAIVESNAPIRKTLRPCMEESKDWEKTGNLYIEGDNLEVLKLLQESYLNSIKVIYIDPPYNTGSDYFVYQDNYIMDREEFEDQIEYRDEKGNIYFKQNNKTNPRFHSDWCSMIYPRLQMSLNLLAEDGVIFISIDDNEQANLKIICDEVFGANCFVTDIVWRSSDNSNNNALTFSEDFNHILVYSKQPNWKPNFLNDTNKRKHFKNPDNDPRGPWFDGNPVNNPGLRVNLQFDITTPSGKVIKHPANGWRWSKDTIDEKLKSGELRFSEDETRLIRRTYLHEMEGLPPSNLCIDMDITGHTRGAKYELKKLFPEVPVTSLFSTPKPTLLIKYLLSLASDKNSIVMDFFSGSATTADAVFQMNSEDGGNRKFIMVQLQEPCEILETMIETSFYNICEMGKERIRRAGEKIKTEIEEKNIQLKLGEEPKKVPDIGFRVLKVDSTNMKDVYYSANEYKQSMISDLESNIKEDRTDLDLLYGVLLDRGLPLSLNHKIEEIDGVKIHIVDENSLIACFEEHVSENVVREIAKRQPLRVVFRDSSFENSPDKINVEEIFKLMAPNTSVKVI